MGFLAKLSSLNYEHASGLFEGDCGMRAYSKCERSLPIDLGLLARSRSNPESLNRPFLCVFHYKNSRIISVCIHRLLAYTYAVYSSRNVSRYA